MIFYDLLLACLPVCVCVCVMEELVVVLGPLSEVGASKALLPGPHAVK